MFRVPTKEFISLKDKKKTCHLNCLIQLSLLLSLGAIRTQVCQK